MGPNRTTSSALDRFGRYGVIAWAILVAVLVTGMDYAGLFQRLEWYTFDHRTRIHRADVGLHPDIAVVLIDDASLQAMNPLVGRYPWPRSVYADLIEFLALGGAKAVMFDLLFFENEPGAGNAPGALSLGDQRLVETTRQTGIVYHAFQLHREELAGEVVARAALPEGFADRFSLAVPAGLTHAPYNAFLLPIEGLHQAARGLGAVGFDADGDGVYRRTRLLQPYDGRFYPSLSVAPLLERLEADAAGTGQGRLVLGGRAVPLDAEGHFLANMVGKPEAYSISGLFAAIEKIRSGDFTDLVVSPDEFAGKIVFIGSSAVGLADIKASAVSARTPGVVLHASIASNLLTGDFLTSVPPWLTVLLALGFSGVALAAAGGLRSMTLQLLVPVLLLAAYVGWSYWRFGDGQVYSVLPPSAAILLASFTGFATRAYREGRDRRRVRNMLSQYVSPEMLSEVLDNYREQLHAGVGSRERLSILFSDVRGFTELAEALSAEQVVEILNIHFSAMGEIIFEEKGTLDKFIGDAIMAFWGAPIRVENHAQRAVRAAVKMLRGLPAVNRTLAEKGYTPIDIGVGIHTGEVVLGNIGSERKLDYTAIGDGVNLASRLEGLTKYYGVPLIISDSTRVELKDAVVCAIVDRVRVKGKHEPIRIHWPLCLAEDDPDTVRRSQRTALLISEAFDCYTVQDWDGAVRRYSQLPDAPLAQRFIARCEVFRETPPPEGWDGVYTMISK